jgi:hypothetical protein
MNAVSFTNRKQIMKCAIITPAQKDRRFGAGKERTGSEPTGQRLAGASEDWYNEKRAGHRSLFGVFVLWPGFSNEQIHCGMLS